MEPGGIAIPLILHQEREGFKVTPEGLAFLESIDKKIGVISVAGKYRTGKSYLLNKIILGISSNGFGVGPTINPCTKGIWIYNKAIDIKTSDGDDISLLILDSEGLGAFDEDANHDTRIFMLAVLLSSFFIYNSVGSIDENALNNISLIINLTKNLQIRASDSELDVEELSNYFPSLLWVLRDFSLQLVDEEGYQINSNQYLNSCLQPVNETSEETKQKNSIRKILREFFKDRECFTFVRPVNQEKKLRNIQEVPYDELRREFKEQMNGFVERIYTTAKVKMIDGIAINGKLLSTLLEVYVDAINRDAVPTISTAWERTIDTHIKESYKKSYDTYKKLIKDVKIKIPIDELQLRAFEGEARKSGLKILESVPIISALKDEIDKNKCKYLEKCDQTLENLLIENYNSSKSKTTSVLKDAFEAFEDKILNSEKLHWVPEEFSQLYDVI